MVQRMCTFLILMKTDRLLSKKKKDYTNAYPTNNASFLYMPLIIAVINPLHFTNMINKHDFHLL